VTRDFFHGYAMNAVDSKNRLSIPAAYREVVERRSEARAVVLAPHERAPCLIGYDRRHSVRLQDQLEQRFAGQFGDERDDYARLAFGMSELIPYDDNGRIIISPMLKEFGEIDRLAFFLAAGDYFEVWNPHVLLETKGSDPRLARLVRRQLEARGESA
jgi:MraZ protein